MEDIKIIQSGDSALFCKFGERIDPDISRSVVEANRSIKSALLLGVIETVPSYSGIMVYFDPILVDYADLAEKLFSIIREAQNSDILTNSRLIEVPVAYGGTFGPDLRFIAEHSGLSEKEIIAIHSSSEYLIYMLGFTPGFPYLGGIDNRIAAPRKSTPRIKIDAGSVGIAGNQTGIYPIDSPGGWQIIGKTPLKLFNINRSNPFLFNAGDYIKFVPVSSSYYSEINEAVRSGNYKIKITSRK